MLWKFFKEHKQELGGVMELLTTPEVVKQLRDEMQRREKSKDAERQKGLHKTQTKIYPNSEENNISSSDDESDNENDDTVYRFRSVYGFRDHTRERKMKCSLYVAFAMYALNVLQNVFMRMVILLYILFSWRHLKKLMTIFVID